VSLSMFSLHPETPWPVEGLTGWGLGLLELLQTIPACLACQVGAEFWQSFPRPGGIAGSRATARVPDVIAPVAEVHPVPRIVPVVVNKVVPPRQLGSVWIDYGGGVGVLIGAFRYQAVEGFPSVRGWYVS